MRGWRLKQFTSLIDQITPPRKSQMGVGLFFVSSNSSIVHCRKFAHAHKSAKVLNSVLRERNFTVQISYRRLKVRLLCKTDLVMGDGNPLKAGFASVIR